MTTYAWPQTWQPQSLEVQLVPAVRRFESPYGGSAQALDLLGERWRFMLQLAPRRHASMAALEAYVARLRGPAHWVSLWHFARPAPRGSLRGSPVLAANAAQGADTLSITTTAAATVFAGDLLGLGGMLLQAAADATADGAGAMTLTLATRLRSAVSSGTALTWDRPTATFALADGAGVPVRYRPGAAEPLVLDMLEVW